MSLSLWTIVFGQFWVVLRHFKSNQILVKKSTGVDFLQVFSENHVFSIQFPLFFEKFSYPSNLHEIELWWSHGIVLLISSLTTSLQALQWDQIDASGDLVRSTLESWKFLCWIAHALPRARVRVHHNHSIGNFISYISSICIKFIGLVGFAVQ